MGHVADANINAGPKAAGGLLLANVGVAVGIPGASFATDEAAVTVGPVTTGAANSILVSPGSLAA